MEEKLNDLENRTNNAWQKVVEQEERISTLIGEANAFSDKVNALEQRLTENLSKFDSLNNHFIDYFNKPTPEEKSKFETVTEHQQNISQFLKSATELKEQIEGFKEFIYGNETTGKTGFKKETELWVEKDKSSIADQQKKWEETYQTLYEKIEGLVPGATSTGLSKAYQDQKTNYTTPIAIWSAVFSLVIIGMVIFAIDSYSQVKEVAKLSDSLLHIVDRLPFFIPAVWLAIFASKQQSQFKRLQQEYIYKETLSKSYEAYKREIDKLPDGDEKNKILEKLIKSMVDMCGYNPSITLEHKSHNDKPPITWQTIFRSPKTKSPTEETIGSS